MKKLAISLLLMLSVPAFAVSVKRQAKDNIKKKQNLEQTITNLLAEAAKPTTRHKQRMECYLLAAECSKRINEIENEKLYLGKAYDTTKFYNSIRDLFERIAQTDSVSRQPNEKGVIKRGNTRAWRNMLLPYRSNLLTGGKWYYRKGQLTTAYRFFDTYLQSSQSDLFAPDHFLTADTLLPSTAYLAVFCAQSERQPDAVIKHAPLAKLAGMKSHLVQEYCARAYELKGDTTQWLQALYEGLHDYPRHPYFFSQLIDLYMARGNNERGLQVCDSLLHERDTVPLYWYGKSLLLMRLHRDREAIDACDSCLRLQPDNVNAHYNKGIASLNLAVEYSEQACTDLTDPRCQRDREIIHSLYLLAKQPMEKVRELAPADKERWAAPLYRIYLNLNMGREFDEMDRILNQMKTP